MSKVYIGTSGWQYSHWKGNFYPVDLPQKDWLRYYSKYFDSVEVNSSFYRQTKASTFEKWKSEVPAGFTFSIKGNRFITHIKRLKDVKEPVNVFFDSANSLLTTDYSQKSSSRLADSCKHVILWQLPPSLKKDIERLKAFLELLPDNFRHAFEFRHQSWVDKETFTTFLGGGVAATVVFQDWMDWPAITEDSEIYRRHRKDIEKLPFIYVRFHGKDMLYSSDYSKKDLEVWAKKMQEWEKERDIYAYFNNDAMGYAAPNALKLKSLI